MLADYQNIIVDREQRACAGLKLIFGLDNPWADVLYYHCLTQTTLVDSLFALTLNIVVDIPMVTCICKDATNQPITQYAMETCAPKLPATLVPTLYMIVNQLTGNVPGKQPELACSAVLGYVRNQVSTAMDPWFTSAFSGLDALADSIDYALVEFDPTAGQCLDFDSDPHVVVIVPQPADYFLKCAGTSICQERCAAEWLAFTATNSTPIPLESFEVTTESLFFPGRLDVATEMTSAVAATEVPWSGKCTQRATSQQDYCVALAQLGDAGLYVQYWCAPLIPAASVYLSTQNPGIPATSLPGTGTTLFTCAFGDAGAAWVVTLLRVGSENQVYMLDKTGWTSLLTLAQLGQPGMVPTSIVNVWAIDKVILADVTYRQSSGGNAPVTLSTIINYYWVYPDTNNTGWSGADVDLSPYGGTYWLARLGTSFTDTYLLLPQQRGPSALMVSFQFTQAGVSFKTHPTPLAELDPVSYLGAVQGDLLASYSLTSNYVFAVAVSGWNWLQQMRLAGTAVSGVFNSAQVTSTVVGNHGKCDGTGCEGCADLLTNRLCLAYSACALANCVGTPVNQRRPLCGIGEVLSFTGRMGITSLSGGWTIFTEMILLTMQVTLEPSAGVNIAWPEDAFMGYVCTAKDASAEFFSVLTSTVNSALYLGHANIDYMYGGASDVDTNADAMLTISSTAINAFLHQIALAPIFGLVVGHQIMMCQVDGVLASFDSTSFTLTLQSAALAGASDIIAGQCLTIGDEQVTQNLAVSGSSVNYTLGSVAENLFDLALIQTIEPLLHTIDGVIAYTIGVVQTLGGLIQSQNMATCNPPNFVLNQQVLCACGDTQLTIQPSLLPQFDLWCTGTLAMVDSNNNQFIVYNPYSYQTLQAMSSGLQAFVDCESSVNGYKCPAPTDPVFAQQGINTINVLVKCRENYVNERWDPAAYILFNASLHGRIKYQSELIPVPPDDSYGVKACLYTSQASGTGNAGCLDNLLQQIGMTWDEYWAYAPQTQTGAQYTDACVTFTGPAALGVQLFQNCTDADEGHCTLNGHCWSSASNNDHPVCFQHLVLYPPDSTTGLVQRLYSDAQDLVQAAVSVAYKDWSGPTAPVRAQFFSVEGDLIHQILDCIFMGPYSRVDYWPTPPCQANEECLYGPYWARDDNQGLSRNVDPTTCKSTPSLPYTCGSPARQSLVSYFINTIVTGTSNSNGSALQLAILAQIKNIKTLWGDTTNYPCECPTGPASLACCTLTNVLPSVLNQTFMYLNASVVLDALDNDYQTIWDLASQSAQAWTSQLPAVDEAELARYDWNGSKRVRDEALYDPVLPVYDYQEDSANSPLPDNQHSLWDICHSALKQVFFTLPVYTNGSVIFGASLVNGTITSDALNFDALEYEGDPDTLEQYVQALSQQAFLDSPLYRQYYPSHAPSDSALCAGYTPVTTATGLGRFDDYVQAGIPMVAGDSLPTFPIYDYRSFTIGQDLCLCGWQVVSGTCYVQDTATCAAVCALVKCIPGCRYNRSLESVLIRAFSPTWDCPETQLSAHWGLLDSTTTEAWLQGQTTLTTSTRDLLQYGRSGPRIGSVSSLPAIAKASINPTTRTVPLDRARLTTCQYQAQLANLTNLADEFIQQLFPMAQGVEESGAVAYCTRYIIETARLGVLNATLPGSSEFSAQLKDVATWRRRCGSQLRLLGLCSNLDVFRPVATWKVYSKQYAKTCEHFAEFSSDHGYTMAYTTPECLVNINGVFYDPCRCVTCDGDSSYSLDLPAILANPACKIRFDPRQLLGKTPVGWWPAGVADELNTLAQDPVNFMYPEAAENLLDDPDSQANTPYNSDAWYSAEGPMPQNAEFCDMISDYWPDDWVFPVGYHVTMPCDQDDTAYRSFLQAFALDSDTEGNPVLRYQHDLLRDVNSVDTNYGAGGLCRSGNLGQPMPRTNIMTYCTQQAIGLTEDYTVPDAGQIPPVTAWTQQVCSPDSSVTPWPDYTQNTGPFDSALYSVGTVPNMPPLGGTSYPASTSTLDNWQVGPAQEVARNGRSWGRQCSDYELDTCASTAECIQGYQCLGMRCQGISSLTCSTAADCPNQIACLGVCTSALSDLCLQHADCPQDKMCDGVGSCVHPTIVVANMVSTNDMTFQLYANQTCGNSGTEYSMSGGSYYSYVGQDLLRMHGMCSYGDWFRYTQVTQKCAVSQDDTSFTVDPTSCQFFDLYQPSNVQNLTYWWDAHQPAPTVMAMRPTNCDRDYERLQGFPACAPLPGVSTYPTPTGTANILSSSGTTGYIQYDQYARMYSDTSRSSIKMAKMPFSNASKFGFLGLGPIATLQGSFESCSVVSQCYPAPFTVNGLPATRFITKLQQYPDNDAFTCGVIGYLNGSQCQLDDTVFPLYRVLCRHTNQAYVDTCQKLVPNIGLLCSAISEYYPPGNDNILANVDALVALFYAFQTVSTLPDYLNLVSCMQLVYSDITALAQATNKTSLGLYYPLEFVLFEFPFAWYYQCMALQGLVNPIDATNALSQDCSAFKTASKHPTGSLFTNVQTGGDDFMTYLRFVQGGYTQAEYDAYTQTNLAATSVLVEQCVSKVKNANYGSATVDHSYPRCSTRLRWTVGDYGGDTWTMSDGQVYSGPQYDTRIRSVIWSMLDSSTCQSNWLADVLSTVGPEFGVTLDTWTSNSLFVIPDPDEQFIETQPGFSQITLMDLVEQFALGQLEAKTTPIFYGTGSVPPGSSQLTSENGIVVFNTAMLPVYSVDDPAYQANLLSLTPTTQYDLGIEVYAGDQNTNETCVFSPSDDPNIGDIYAQNQDACTPEALPGQQSGLTDHVYVCKTGSGELVCSKVPEAYKRDGYYGCGYTPMIQSTCTEDPSVASTCVYPQLNALYQQFTRCYQAEQPAVPSLPTESLPWLPGSPWGVPFSFVLADAIAYQTNIQPDKTKPIMCNVDTTASQAINFSQCTSPHYERLKQHTQANYMHEGGVVVPPLTQLEWTVDQGLLARGVIMAYSQTERPIESTFMQALFDDATVCTGSVQGNERICYKDFSDATISLNPWLLGYWNPYSMCDVEFTPQNQGGNEFINSQCLARQCYYNNSMVTGNSIFNDNMPFAQTCLSEYQQNVQIPGVPRTYFDSAGNVDYLPYNLCAHAVVEQPQMCTQDQGLLGGYDGLPIGADPSVSVNMVAPFLGVHPDWAGTYQVSRNMYEESVWGIPSDFQGGLFAGTNPILAGQQAPFGFLRIPTNELGVHRVGLAISREPGASFSNMSILKLPLYDPQPGLSLTDAKITSLDVQDWVPGLLKSIQADHEYNLAFESIQLLDNYTGYSCPLLRFAFYSSLNEKFAPSIPSPLRARQMFGDITGNSLAHPTMTQSTDGTYLGQYTTHNGFCFCPVMRDIPQTHCMVPVQQKDSSCSLYQTIQALQGTPLQSLAYPPLGPNQDEQTCTMQLDWPNVDLPLRDGSAYPGGFEGASDPAAKKCHILDRLVPFKYQYQPATSLGAQADPGVTTIQAGVCQTGRVATLNPAVTQSAGRCVRSTLKQASMTLTCDAAESQPTLTRRQPLTAEQIWTAFQRQTRRKCSTCSSPPKFTTQAGASMQPESSFGQPFRVSAERMLAKDLRDALCNTTNGCPSFNRSAWVRGEFMRNYLLHPEYLFLTPDRVPPVTQAVQPVASGDDSAYWTEPWVYCPSTTALKSSQGCTGTISRDVWLSSRTSICPSMLKSLGTQGGQDPMATTAFCNIDKSTLQLCQAVEEARLLVIKANCIASGKDPSCLPTPFVYHPASFDTTNQAWVHDTVQDFYLLYNPDVCPAASAELATVNKLASKFQSSCPANSVNTLVGVLQVVRKVVTEIALVLSTLATMAVRLAALLFQGTGSAASQATFRSDLLKDWAWVKKETNSAIGTLGDMLFDMLLNSGPLGRQILNFLYNTCDALAQAYDWFLNVWCNYIITHMSNLMGSLRVAMGMTRAGFEMLNDFMNEVFQGVLPAEFVEKYGNKGFQSVLTAAFDEPTKHETVGPNDKVKASVELKPVSRISQAKNVLSKISSALSSPIFRAAGYLAIGAGIAFAVDDAIQDSELSKLYPSNWTLFDFSDVVNQLDFIETFLGSGEVNGQCNMYQALQNANTSYTVINCQRLELAKYYTTQTDTTSITATTCWATADQSIGESSLFSCTPSSTCCADETCTPCDPTDPTCTTMVPCLSCPLSAQQGTAQFACDSYQQLCRYACLLLGCCTFA